jgi:hypothetical protein
VQWLLRSIGRNPDKDDPQGDPWLMSQLVPAIISPQVGLQDASGAQLAAWITQTYGAEMGFVAHSAPLVTFDDVLAGAGVNPTLIGGRRWNHWSGVRKLNADGTLAIANPSDGWQGVGQTMSRAQFSALGDFSAIWIDRTGAVPAPPPPAPEPPAPPAPSRVQVLVDEIRERLDEIERLTA